MSDLKPLPLHHVFSGEKITVRLRNTGALELLTGEPEDTLDPSEVAEFRTWLNGLLPRSAQLGDTCEVCGGKWVRAPEGLGIMHNCPGSRPSAGVKP